MGRLIMVVARTAALRGTKARAMRVDVKKAREESVMAVMERNIWERRGNERRPRRGEKKSEREADGVGRFRLMESTKE